LFEQPLDYQHMTVEELTRLCKKRGIRLNKEQDYNKFKIIQILKDDDRNPSKANMCVGLFFRLCQCDDG
jgi:hypothetical protein